MLCVKIDGIRPILHNRHHFTVIDIIFKKDLRLFKKYVILIYYGYQLYILF